MFICPGSASAQSAEQLDALTKLNEARRQNGVAPLAWNAQLAKAAQRHSDDMAAKGFVDEIGSDGSSSRQRVEATGYAKWPGVRIWGESIYAGQTNFDEALNFLLSDDVQRRALLNPKLREVAIGVGKDNLRIYWTVTLGSQPNLLPIFVNDGAPVTKERQVAVQLTQEEAVPQGDANAIGRVVEVRISDRSDFGAAAWQPWEPLLPFTLSRGTGSKTVYVQMRDGVGKLTLAAATIEYDPNSQAVPKPVSPGALPTLEPTLLPTLAPPPKPSVTPTEATTLSTTFSTTLATATIVTDTLLTPPLATSTAVVIGAPVVADAAAVATPSSTSTAQTMAALPAPTPTSAAVVVLVAPAPTATLVIPQARNEGNSEITTIVLTPPPDARPSPQAPAASALPDWVLPTYLVAQTVAIVVGLVIFIRRK